MSCQSHLTNDPYCWACNEASRQEAARVVAAMNAPYVEGREAPEGDALVGAGAYPPRGARREGREAPRREGACGADGEHGDYCDLPAQHEGVPHMTNPAARAYLELERSIGEPDAATVEACARAAYTVGRKHWAGDPHWEDLPRVTAEHWREVARAALAAAGRGGK